VLAGVPREQPDGASIDGVRQLLLLLALVHLGVGGAVEQERGPVGVEKSADVGLPRHVACGAVEGDGGFAAGGERAEQCVGEHPAAAGDEDPVKGVHRWSH
jgi:hypothetical protein